jgi:hypothetical protein
VYCLTRGLTPLRSPQCWDSLGRRPRRAGRASNGDPAMTSKETLRHIKTLLDRFPGACVTNLHEWPDRTDIALYVVDHESLTALARCCAAANIILTVEPSDSWKDAVQPPGRMQVRYIIRASHDPARVEAFGVYLARAIHNIGLMNRDELETLCSELGRIDG